MLAYLALQKESEQKNKMLYFNAEKEAPGEERLFKLKGSDAMRINSLDLAKKYTRV